jgi:hypothetical protein
MKGAEKPKINKFKLQKQKSNKKEQNRQKVT